jgi:hypothetical protein
MPQFVHIPWGSVNILEDSFGVPLAVGEDTTLVALAGNMTDSV